MDDVTRREAMKLATTAGAAVTGAVVLGAAGSASAQDEAKTKAGAKGEYRGRNRAQVDEPTPAEIEAYERVAQVVGEEANTAYIRIIERLASGRGGGGGGGDQIPVVDGGPTVSMTDLRSFFKVLGGTALDFSFQAATEKAQKYVFLPRLIEPDPEIFGEGRLIGGEITFGGRIIF